jgi:hypothetical protein
MTSPEESNIYKDITSNNSNLKKTKTALYMAWKMSFLKRFCNNFMQEWTKLEILSQLTANSTINSKIFIIGQYSIASTWPSTNLDHIFKSVKLYLCRWDAISLELFRKSTHLLLHRIIKHPISFRKKSI